MTGAALLELNENWRQNTSYNDVAHAPHACTSCQSFASINKMADFEENDPNSDYLLHGCRCSDGDHPDRPHFHCPGVVCDGKVVSLMTGWRHRVKNRKVVNVVDQKLKDLGDYESMDEASSRATPECDYKETMTARISASYSQLPANESGNLAMADPLLLGDDAVHRPE